MWGTSPTFCGRLATAAVYNLLDAWCRVKRARKGTDSEMPLLDSPQPKTRGEGTADRGCRVSQPRPEVVPDTFFTGGRLPGAGLHSYSSHQNPAPPPGSPRSPARAPPPPAGRIGRCRPA